MARAPAVPTAVAVLASLDKLLSIPFAAVLQFLSRSLNTSVCFPAAVNLGVNLSVKFNIVLIVLPISYPSQQP